MVRFNFQKESFIFQDTLCLVDFLRNHCKNNQRFSVVTIPDNLDEALKAKFHAFRFLDGDLVAFRLKRRCKENENPIEVVASGREDVAALIEKESLVREEIQLW